MRCSDWMRAEVCRRCRLAALISLALALLCACGADHTASSDSAGMTAQEDAGAGAGAAGSSGAGAGEVQVPPRVAPNWVPDDEIDFYGRATLAVSSDGVAAEWGAIIQGGALVPAGLLRGELLVIGLLGDRVRSTTTEHDPRIVSGVPDPQTGMAFGAMLEEGSFTFSFPGQHVHSPDHLRATRFDVYQLGNVPFDVAVTPDNADALREGAILLGSVEGADMLTLFFP